MDKQSSRNISTDLLIPKRLPLLEGLCWNIRDCYDLDPPMMLAIYEERWGYKGVLGQPNLEEINFISDLIALYNGLPLIEEISLEFDKGQVNESIKLILGQLNIELLSSSRAALGGGTLISTLP